MLKKPFPGYEKHLLACLNGDSEEIKNAKDFRMNCIMSYELPDGMKMEDRLIPGYIENEDLKIRIFTPAGLKCKAPIVLDIHGGGWVGGNLDIDNRRCIAIASRIPAIVISVEYHLSGKEHHFPTPLMDCYTAYMWAHDHAEEIGGDPEKMGVHGSSAGANIAAGLALYLRDNKGPAPCLNVLNCPCVNPNYMETHSYHQNIEVDLNDINSNVIVESIYLGGYNGTQPSYYAFPGLANDLRRLKSHMIIVGEYDSLRDDGIAYANRLLRVGVHCSLLVGPKLGHCFTAIPHPFTDLTHDLIAMSYKADFGMI